MSDDNDFSLEESFFGQLDDENFSVAQMRSLAKRLIERALVHLDLKEILGDTVGMIAPSDEDGNILLALIEQAELHVVIP